MRTHAYLTLQRCIKALQAMKEERPEAVVHCVVYGEWGCGKTKALQKLCKEMRLPYWKVEKKLTINQFIRKLTRAAAETEAGRDKDQNIDVIVSAMLRRPLPQRIVVIDEAQRIYKASYLDELKDLSELEGVMISFLFVGDETIRPSLAETFHSLNKRIFTVYLERIGQATIEEFMKKYGLSGDVKELTKFARDSGLVTLDIDNAFFFLKKAGVNSITPHLISEALAQLKRRVA